LYAQQIRQEYIHYPEEAYRIGRSKVLEGFLASNFLFKTPIIREKFEDKARENLRKEISQLTYPSNI